MDYHIRLHVTTAVIVITLGITVSLITSTVVGARAYRARGVEATRRAQTITVKGSTRQRIRSDRAVWPIGVQGEGQTLQEAFGVLDAGVKRVQRFLTEQGFADGETGLCAIDTNTHYRHDEKGQETHEIVGYGLQRAFVVTTGDVARVEQSAGRVTELIQEGVLVASHAPAYYYTGLSQLKIDLMAAASGDARSRAQRIADSTACKLAELRDAQMGVLQITKPDSTETSGYGVYDTTTIEKDVTAVVTATFGIQAD
jgi:hypothetical protein